MRLASGVVALLLMFCSVEGTAAGGKAFGLTRAHVGPTVLNVKSALALCGGKRGVTLLVDVRGQLHLRHWKPADAYVDGVLFDQVRVPANTQYDRRWVSFRGLLLVIPSRLFRYLQSLGNSHPPVTWRGRLHCAGPLSRLAATSLRMFLPVSGRTSPRTIGSATGFRWLFSTAAHPTASRGRTGSEQYQCGTGLQLVSWTVTRRYSTYFSITANEPRVAETFRGEVRPLAHSQVRLMHLYTWGQAAERMGREDHYAVLRWTGGHPVWLAWLDSPGVSGEQRPLLRRLSCHAR